jgi:hypothetical protein
MGKGTIEFVATAGIHKEWLEKKFIDTEINTNNANTVVFQTKNGNNFFLNPNFQIRFGNKGIELEGYFLIENCLGGAVLLITDYKSNETGSIV